MKKIGYILLSFLLLLQAGGLLMFYQVQQACAHRDGYKVAAKEYRHREKIRLPLSLYYKFRMGKDELRIGGRMYDIRSIKVSSDEVELVVVRDRKEERAVCKITQLLKRGSVDNSVVPTSILDLLSFVYLLPESIVLHFVPCISDARCLDSKDYFPSTFLSITSPPPKGILCLL